MKCGDIVRNYWAGDKNPTRYFVYLKNEGKYTSAISFDGKRLRKAQYYSDHIKKEPDKFVVVGYIDLIDYIKAPLLELLRSDCREIIGGGENENN